MDDNREIDNKRFAMAEAELRKPSSLSFKGNVAENWQLFEEDFEIYRQAVLYNKPAKVCAYFC